MAEGNITYQQSQLVMSCQRYANGSNLNFYPMPAAIDKSFSFLHFKIPFDKYCYTYAVGCWEVSERIRIFPGPDKVNSGDKQQKCEVSSIIWNHLDQPILP